jgi:hypothetical protein
VPHLVVFVVIRWLVRTGSLLQLQIPEPNFGTNGTETHGDHVPACLGEHVHCFPSLLHPPPCPGGPAPTCQMGSSAPITTRASGWCQGTSHIWDASARTGGWGCIEQRRSRPCTSRRSRRRSWPQARKVRQARSWGTSFLGVTFLPLPPWHCSSQGYWSGPRGKGMPPMPPLPLVI